MIWVFACSCTGGTDKQRACSHLPLRDPAGRAMEWGSQETLYLSGRNPSWHCCGLSCIFFYLLLFLFFSTSCALTLSTFPDIASTWKLCSLPLIVLVNVVIQQNVTITSLCYLQVVLCSIFIWKMLCWQICISLHKTFLEIWKIATWSIVLCLADSAKRRFLHMFMHYAWNAITQPQMWSGH